MALYCVDITLVQGFVISDWEALDRLSSPRGSNYRSCVSVTVNAGIDMVGLKPKPQIYLLLVT